MITAGLIAAILVANRSGLVFPIPFLILMISVALAGALGGLRAGAIAGILMSGLIYYTWFIGDGPPPLTGTIWRATLGSAVSIGLGSYLGALHDRLDSLFLQLQEKRRELAELNDQLAARVATRTSELEATRNKLIRNQVRLQRVTKQWVEAQEIERRNLARDLHDDIGQCLTALRINLENWKNSLDHNPDLLEFVQTSVSLVDDVIDSVRQISLNLRPSLLDDLGFFAAIREHAAKQLGLAGIPFELSTTGDDSIIDAPTSITAFRVAQESIANILRHAGASQAVIDMRVEPTSLSLEISDDGTGFDSEAKRHESEHFGLASMRERVKMVDGEFSVVSESGVGTTIRATLPLRKATIAA